MRTPSEAESIPLARVRKLIEGGQALPLLPGTDGPVRIGAQWWAIPAGSAEAHFVRVADSDAIETFDDYAHRLDLARRA